jgi:hypothetical protein
VWANIKSTIHMDEGATIELTTGIENTKSTAKSTKDTEDENNKSEKKVLG